MELPSHGMVCVGSDLTDYLDYLDYLDPVTLPWAGMPLAR